jgi:tetratricopeptide (TPR) repeat protein
MIYWLNLGYFYEQQQNWEAASAAYGQVLRQQRSAAGSGFWQADPVRWARWPQIVSAALGPESAAGRAAFRLDLVRLQNAGTLSDPEELLALLDPASQFQVDLVEWYLYRNELDAVAALLKPVPQSGRDHLWWGRYRLQNGELDKAEPLLKTAAFQRVRQAYYHLGQLYEMRGDLRAAEIAYQRAFSIASPENIDVTIYGRYGGNDLAPQLIQLGDAQQSQTLRALIELYRNQKRIQETDRLTRLLHQLDPFLSTNQEK